MTRGLADDPSHLLLDPLRIIILHPLVILPSPPARADALQQTPSTALIRILIIAHQERRRPRPSRRACTGTSRTTLPIPTIHRSFGCETLCARQVGQRRAVVEAGFRVGVERCIRCVVSATGQDAIRLPAGFARLSLPLTPSTHHQTNPLLPRPRRRHHFHPPACPSSSRPPHHPRPRPSLRFRYRTRGRTRAATTAEGHP